jgi:hypothetical protein
MTQQTIKNKKKFYVTKAGYMYRDGKRASEQKVNPLTVPYDELNESEIAVVRAHNAKYWRMI